MGDHQKKSVRFVDNPPRTPSPASSSAASYGSSPGPFTPPSVLPLPHLPPVAVHPGSSAHPTWQHLPTSPPQEQHTSSSSPLQPFPSRSPTAPLPAPSFDLGASVAIDSLLAVPSHPTHTPPLRWDVNVDPNAIKVAGSPYTRLRDLTHEDLARPAVRRGAKGSPLLLRQLHLVFPGLPLAVRVSPADDPIWTSVPLPYLTVGDVLFALHRALRTSIEPHEFDVLEPKLKEEVRKSFERRLSREGPHKHEKNMSHGARRIDYLGDSRGFVGLRLADAHELPAGTTAGEVFVVVAEPVL